MQLQRVEKRSSSGKLVDSGFESTWEQSVTSGMAVKV